jgi:VanZ family protein
MRRAYFYVFLFFLWFFSVIYNASLPSRIPADLGNLDKIIHFIYYIPGGFLAFMYISAFGQISLLASFLLALSVSITDEFIQSFIPGRQADFFDIVADAFGIILGIYLGIIREKSNQIREKLKKKN